MYAEVLYTQPSWCSFSSWPHSDITSLSRSVTCTFLALPFFTAELFLEYYYITVLITTTYSVFMIFWHQSFVYEVRYNSIVTLFLTSVLLNIGIYCRALHNNNVILRVHNIKYPDTQSCGRSH